MRRAWLTVIVVAVAVALSACGSRGPGVDSAADWSDIQIPEGTLVVASPGQYLAEMDYKESCRVVDEWWDLGLEYQVGEDVVVEGTLIGAGELSYLVATRHQSGWPQGLTAFDLGLREADQGVGYQSAVTVIWPGDLPASMPSTQPDAWPPRMHVKVWGVCQTLIPSDYDSREFPSVLGRYVTCYPD